MNEASGDRPAGEPPADTAPQPDTPDARLLRFIRAVNRVLHVLAGMVLVGLMLLVVADVIGRRFFGRPLVGTVELVEMGMVAVIYLGLGYAEHEGDHVALDLVFDRLGARTRSVLRVVTGVLSVAVMGLVTWQLVTFSGVLADGGYTTAVLRIPQAEIGLVAVAGAAAFLAAIAAGLVVALRVRRDRGAPEDPSA